MKNIATIALRLTVAASLIGTLSAADYPTNPDTIVTTRATGTFDVKITPQATDTPTEGSPLGRLSIDKQFHGDLEGTSKGEMLTAGTAIKNSAVYVAVERVTGTLHGKTGTFALHHTGIMNRGDQSLTITVVPDSGTGELTGITGTLSIEIATASTHTCSSTR